MAFRDQPNWHKSSRSAANGACVEVANLNNQVLVRDSKDPNGPQLGFTPESWMTFMDAIQGGDFRS